jgi:hypothetical protein
VSGDSKILATGGDKYSGSFELLRQPGRVGIIEPEQKYLGRQGVFLTRVFFGAKAENPLLT